MDSANGINITCPSSLKLAPQVVLGAIDISASGARALWALQPPEGWSVREVAAGMSGIHLAAADGGYKGASALRPVLGLAVEPATATTAAAGPLSRAAKEASTNVQQQEGDCTTAATPAAPLLVVRNMYGPTASKGGGTGEEAVVPQVSLVILNAAVPREDQAELAAALLAFIAERGPKAAPAAGGGAPGLAAEGPSAPSSCSSGAGAGASVFLAASMLMQQHARQPEALYQHLLNGAQALAPGLPALPTGTTTAATGPVRVRDGQLAALLHVTAVSGTPTCCLLAPGYKPPASTSLDLPDSLPACDALGAALAAALGLKYDMAKCRTTLAQYKWFLPDRVTGSDVMYC